jgi:N-acyl-D-aspartate/D-glutamate deacylase
MLDYLIKNGKIVDGSGAEPFFGDIGVDGDEIVFINRTSFNADNDNDNNADKDIEAKNVIDATGLVVTPGFIDIHCHSDAVLFHESKNPQRLLQGFTTEVIGNCGMSLAPVNDKNLDLLKKYCDPHFSHMPIPYAWHSFGEYLAAVEECGPLLNTVALVGHGALRIAVAGFDDRRLEAAELAKMKELLVESLDSGAFGFSSGLFYAPGVFSDEEEIVALAEIAARYGGIYSTHLRSESVGLIKSVAETLRVTERTGVNTEFSHHKASGKAYFGNVKTTLQMIADANDRGFNVNCDVYPYIAANTQFSSILPPWALEGGSDALLRRLAEPELRRKMIVDLKNEGTVYENLYQLSGWDKIIINECTVAEYVGKTVEQIAAENGKDPFEMALEIIEHGDNSAMMIIELMSEADVSEVIAGRYSMICTDGFPSLGKRHPRYTSSFIRVLEKYVKNEHLLTLSEAVYKMSGLPAQKLGLSDRGLLRPGYKADILIMDIDELHDNADYERYDALADGMKFVFINGVAAMENGIDKQVCAGRVLRSTDYRL